MAAAFTLTAMVEPIRTGFWGCENALAALALRSKLSHNQNKEQKFDAT